MVAAVTVAARLNSLWIGPSLGAVERACLRSALAQGHEVTLWCYERPEGVPEGIEFGEAADILPAGRIVRHENGSPALFANLFRYELQRRGLGTWIDCDVYLLAPIEAARPYLFAWEGRDVINNAVLRLPADSPMLAPLIALFDERRVPSWLPWRHRLAAWRRLRRTGRTGLSHMPWGSAGPKALTALARRHRRDRWALPPRSFYPVPWQRAGWIREPSIGLDEMIGADTVGVHLWHEVIRPWKDEPARPGSFLARLQAEGA